jgi:histidyl-tRNA synthetase
VPREAQDRFFIAVDKLDKVGWDGVTTELVEAVGLGADVVAAAREKVEALADVPAGKVGEVLGEVVPDLPEEVAEDLGATVDCLAALPRAVRWSFDPTLVRGMGYYTGQIFEVTHPGAAGSIAGGGRYDELIGRSLGTAVPACGFSIGFERIVDLVSTAPEVERLAVLYDAEVPARHALAAARTLRERRGAVVAPVRRSGKLPAQLTRLENWGYTAFLPLGADQDPDALPEPRPLGGQPA